MKTRFKLFAIGAICSILLIYSQSFSQNYIQIDETFLGDTTIRPFENIGNIYGLKISGNANLNSDTSLVRVIFTDISGENFLVYEIYPLLDTNSSISLHDACEETCLLNNIEPYELSFQLIDASIYIDYLTYLDQGIENLEYVRDTIIRTIILDKIDRINETIQAKQLPWYAGETPLVFKTFQEKLDFFGLTTLPNLQGIEYYIGGFFVLLPIEDDRNANRSFTITDEFDWRNRHGANEPTSPYYDGDVTGSGWIPNRQEGQECPDCWAFAPVYTTEAVENLYYNQHINENLSEQYVISCTGDTICNQGGLPEVAIAFLESDGVINEECFPYQPHDDVYCTLQCSIPTERIFISGHLYTYGSSQNGEYNIKKNLIVNGPQSVRMNIWGHAISMVGFGKIKAWDLILDGNSPWNPGDSEKVILPGDPWIGENYWVFKNSWGNWGHNGTEFYYVIADANKFNNAASLLTPLTSMIYDDSDIRCVDLDSDSYYNWGLSLTKPNTCPTCSDSCDCDDSKSYLGPYDENFNCILLCDQFVLDEDTLIISADDTWYGKKYINQIVFIEDTAKLTIKGEVGFCEDAAIIVGRGSELIIDGGLLHGTCSNMWQGIQVWGTATASQSTTGAQGKLTIINGGTIENAIAAVRVARTDGNRYVAGYEGGIIQTDDANFINNRIGVRFYPYRYQVSGAEVDNLSYFYNTEFLTDAELADQSLPEKFIHFDNVKGINVKGCSFINSRPEEETEMYERGVGIYSEDANFTVTDYCLDPPGCEDLISSVFQLLNYGIEAYKEETTKSFDVNNSNFYNNLTGIYIKGVDNPEIIFNNFELKSVSLFHQPGDIFGGLYLDGSPRFTVEENYFYNEDSYDPQSEISSIGITVSNCGDLQNIIYRNTFDRLHLAILAQGRNRGTSISTGLKLHCNVCTNNMNDFAVTADGSALNQGISERQGAFRIGDVTAPAGNLFSHEFSTDPYRDFNNTLSGSRITYYQHNGSPGDSWELTYYQNITKNEYGTYPGHDDACPPHFYSGGHKKSAAIVMEEDDLKDLLIQREYQRDSLINILNLWVDAGDTPQLDYTVESSTPDEALEVYDELISDSPYLSDTVLASSIEKQDVLVNAMVRDIMVANPHGAKKEALVESLEERIPPIPDYMMAEIMNGRDTLSLKELKEGEITWYEQERNSAFAALLNLYLSQTTESSGDSLVSLISNHGYLKDHYLLAARFLEKGDITNSLSVLDELPTKFSMTSGELSEYQDYLTLYSILGDLKLSGQPLDSMNASSRQTLYQIAEDNFTPGMLAQNILQRIDTVDYNEIYILPTSEPTEKKYYGKYPELNEYFEDGVFRVYPNPCLDYFIIEYFFTDVPQNVTYSIIDPLGRTIEKGKIDGQQNQIIKRTSELNPGVFTIQLIINGKGVKATKLTIIK